MRITLLHCYFFIVVHGGGGLWGVVSVPLLAREQSIAMNFNKPAFMVGNNNCYCLSFIIITTSGGSRISRGGGANSPGGAPTYDFAKFSQKLHEIERIWTPRGGGRASKILLCRSATDNDSNVAETLNRSISLCFVVFGVERGWSCFYHGLVCRTFHRYIWMSESVQTFEGIARN